MYDDALVDDAARSILDGAPVDWSTLESSADLETRALIEQLKVLSALGRVHRTETPAAGAPVARRRRPTVIDEPPAQWGHLRLIETIGSGSFADVYRALDTRLDREVALKLRRAAQAAVADASSSVIREGRLLARVRHPNVVTIHGADVIDGHIGLWMELVEGRSLEELLRMGHQFSLQEVRRIGLDLCGAVAAVHAAGVIHRDIKAQNVMRAADGRVVLMDFGTGREQWETWPDSGGTPLYLAPEIFAGHSATARSDIYSLGILLHHLLTGGFPTTARSVEELRRAHESGENSRLRDVRPDLPPAIDAIVARATDASPDGRYATCDDLAADLAAVERRRHLPRPWLAALGAAAMIGLGWFGWPLVVSRAGAGGRPAGGAAVAAAAVGEPVIAVRPFVSLNADTDSQLMVDGFTYELIRNLAIIDGLDVRSASSSFALKGQGLNLAAVGSRLGANLVLEGSVTHTRGRLRVQAQLADVAADRPL